MDRAPLPKKPIRRKASPPSPRGVAAGTYRTLNRRQP